MIRCRFSIPFTLALLCSCQFDPSGIGPVDNRLDASTAADAAAGAGDAAGTSDAAGTVDSGPCAGLHCGFTRRRPVSIDVARITSPLTEIPVAILLDNSNFDYAQTQPNGEDLRFLSENLETAYEYEIEDWNPGGRSVIWVRIPALAPSAEAEKLWLYHGNPMAPAGQNPAAVWSSNFVSVHHLAGNYEDSTSANRNGSTPNDPTAITGPMGPAYYFDGENDYIELTDETAYDFTTNMSASIWLKVDDLTRNWQAPLAKGDHSWRIHRHGGNPRFAFSTTNGSGNHTNHVGSRDINDDTWHHILITYDGSRTIMYIDGEVDVDQGYTDTIGNTIHSVYIGQNGEAGNRHFYGSLDEVRIASTPRSQDWARVEYLSVVDNTFIVIGDEESL